MLAVAAGCSSGPKMVIVKGRLTNGGQPVAASKNDGVTIVFAPAAGGPMTYPAAGFIPAENRYEVFGPAMKGIPLGRYKVSINIMSSKPAPGNDAVNAKYPMDKTPIEVDVTEDGKVDIDLANFKAK
jgi:hypothetical protein